MKFSLKILLRRLIYTVLFLNDTYILKKFNYLFVLCYHSVADDNWRFSVGLKEFKKQIEFLNKRYNFISAQDLYDYINRNKPILKPSLVLCFDDGYKDLLSVKDLLKLYKIRPLLFVLSNPDKADRKELDTNKALLNNSEIKDLINEGWEIGSHGAAHKDMRLLKPEEIEEEIVESKNILERNLKTEIKYFSFPKGRYSESLIEKVKNSGYMMSFTMDDNLFENRNVFKIPRIGIDKTHSFIEFQAAFSPSTIKFRKFIKNLL